MQQTLTARITRLRYTDKPTGFSVAFSDDVPTGVCSGSYRPDEPLEPGKSYQLVGEVKPTNHGPQFVFRQAAEVIPPDRESTVRFLTQVPGIGMQRARLIWGWAGKNTIDVLRDGDLVAMHAATKVPMAMLELAADHVREMGDLARATVEVDAMLFGLRFSAKTVRDALTRWGVAAARNVREDPFRLWRDSIGDSGFKACDRLFLRLYPNDGTSVVRQTHCVMWTMSDGNSTWWSGAEIGARSAEHFGTHMARHRDAITILIDNGVLVSRLDGDRIFYARTHDDSTEQSLGRMIGERCTWN